MQAWRELYVFLYLRENTIFSRDNCNAFIEDTIRKHQAGLLHEWKRKIRRRATLVLLLKLLIQAPLNGNCFSRKSMLPEESLEELRQKYLAFLRTQNLENRTIALYDYAFRSLVEGSNIGSVSEFATMKPEQIQGLLVFLSGKLNLNSRGTIFPIIRQILTYLYAAGFVPVDYSGMVLTPAYQHMHLRPYITAEDEEKLYLAMDETPLRTRAMMRLALRLGLRDVDICNLLFSQLDWKNDQIILEQEKTGVTLYLPLLEDVGNAIMDYIMNERPEAARGCPYVFVREQAPFKKLESMYMVCSRLFAKADIKPINRDSKGPHVCRYTLTHKLLLNKVPHQVVTNATARISKSPTSPICRWKNRCCRNVPSICP